MFKLNYIKNNSLQGASFIWTTGGDDNKRKFVSIQCTILVASFARAKRQSFCSDLYLRGSQSAGMSNESW